MIKKTKDLAPEATAPEKGSRMEDALAKASIELKDAGVVNFEDRIHCVVQAYMKPSYDEATGCLLSKGKPATGMGTMHNYLFLQGIGELNKDGELVPFSKGDVVTAFITLATRYFKFNPIQDYLNSRKGKAPSDKKSMLRWERLASAYLGDGYEPSKEPTLADIQLRKWLVGAAKRALQPGCRNEAMLILKGPQGAGKSTFFRTLAGGDSGSGWYSGDCRLLNLGNKDEQLRSHSAWINEVQEIKFNTGQIQDVKRYITDTTDNIRKPYEPASEIFPRKFVLCGTTNDDDFFVDDTGNRRFWVIETNKTKQNHIDWDQLEQERDWIWAMAVKDYEEGYETWLNSNEENLNDANNKSFKPDIPYINEIETALVGDNQPMTILVDCYMYRGKVWVNPGDIVKNIGSQNGTTRRALECAVIKGLKELGFTKGKNPMVIGGRSKRRYYEAPEDLQDRLRVKMG